jgi:Na+/melibiose symporter-like transporter
MRVLYLFAAVMFTVKAIITYLFTEETTQGKVRMHETRSQSVINVMGEYRGVFQQFLHSPQTLFCAGILMVVGITSLISGNFWAILVTEKLHIPAKDLALFTFLRSAIMLVFFFTVMPRINKMHYKLPLLIGFLIAILSQLILITAPDHGYGFLIANSLLEACCFALIGPFVDKLTVLAIDPQERARIQAVMYLVIILFSSPFGWIAGNLSGINKDLPFILNIALFVIGAVLAYLAGRASQREALPEIETI